VIALAGGGPAPRRRLPRRLQRLARQVTPQLEARRAARIAHDQAKTLSLLPDTMPDGVVSCLADGPWASSTGWRGSGTGPTRANAAGAVPQFRDLTHPDDFAEDMERVAALRSGRCNDFRAEKRYRHRDGGIVRARLAVALVRVERQRPLHVVTHVQDIAEQHPAERRLRVRCCSPRAPTRRPSAIHRRGGGSRRSS